MKNGKTRFTLHYDQDGFEESKKLHLPPFSSVFGSCNGLICVQVFSFVDARVNFILWNPSIQKHISLPMFRISEAAVFGFDSRTNDYKLLILGG
ncbi:hypothetical protein V6N12_042193 [Hibiscus sabdariffa]|uniref:F-box associated domain-containing protein n=1 Tax=Hibiscus sabdariffa TaxID=183260 RepID=A0ABR2EE24_9ROSI